MASTPRGGPVAGAYGMAIFINHLGFERVGSKRAVVEGPPELSGAGFCLVDDADRVVHTGALEAQGPVANWNQRQWTFHRAVFDEFETSGRYRLRIDGVSCESSEPFEIVDRLLLERTLFDCLDYFKSQRCSGAIDLTDRRMKFHGGNRHEIVDVHGGWYDASGDTSKYLSHLSYANFLNPQQTPLLPWVFADAAARLEASSDALDVTLRRRLRDEAAHGGDFLVRMQDESGYFYMTVFDTWSKQLDAREICAYATQRGEKSDRWHAGLRQGGGMAIAALARLARYQIDGEFDAARYLAAARRGFAHLDAHNVTYLDDGVENIIDDYCGLLAATELFLAAGDDEYLVSARRRADALIARLTSDDRFVGWWRADDGARPYFHAVEAGLPIIALCQYHAIEPHEPRRERVRGAVATSLRFELEITSAVPNPFGYARQYVRPVGGERIDSFFVPHHNESGYWWQGENARLASLASAARMGAQLLANDPDLGHRLHVFANDQIDWVLGRNPFDRCMLHGHGRNNPQYERGYPPSAGGICNGITSGFEDESDIAFAPESCRGRGDQIWRWGEQWLPHAAWFVHALGR